MGCKKWLRNVGLVARDLSVTYVLRGSNERHFSIERVFADVAGQLAGHRKIETVDLPCSGVSPDRLLRNLAAAAKIRGDIIHVTGDVHYTLLAFHRRSSRVVTVHDLNRFEQLSGLRRRAYRLLWITPLRRADVITCVSEFSREQLVRADPKLADRCRVIDNPLSEIFVPDPNEVPVPGHIVAIGTAANKNLEATIRACAAIDGASLTVVGSLTEQQLELASNLGVSVRELPGISDEELASVYRSAAVVSFPSTAEGFGLPVIEAQGCGVPVVTSDIAPLNKVANGAALLVDPMDQQALNDALQRAIDGGATIDEMVQVGRINAEQRNAAAIAERYEQVYRELNAADQ